VGNASPTTKRDKEAETTHERIFSSEGCLYIDMGKMYSFVILVDIGDNCSTVVTVF
jgi:hypothetical protein